MHHEGGLHRWMFCVGTYIDNIEDKIDHHKTTAAAVVVWLWRRLVFGWTLTMEKVCLLLRQKMCFLHFFVTR